MPTPAQDMPHGITKCFVARFCCTVSVLLDILQELRTVTKGYSLRQSASCCQASWGLGVLLVQTPALRPILLEMVPLPVADSIQCKVLRTYF